VINQVAHTEKPISVIVIDKAIDRREKLDEFDPSIHSNGAFKEFWREYKEKLRAS
jgi:hypothetical protein